MFDSPMPDPDPDPEAMIPDLKINKQRNSTHHKATHFTVIVYLKQRQEDMLSLIFKKLNLCPVIPASRGVNPLATSHTVEQLSSICPHSRSHDKLIVFLIYHCLDKYRHCLEPPITIKKVFFNTLVFIFKF